MLTLATHEPQFAILREVVFFGNQNTNTCHTCGQPGHLAIDCKGKPKKAESEKGAPAAKKPYQFLYVNVLRESVSGVISVGD